jgi:hypothetical protein
MTMDMKMNRIFITITLAICLCIGWTRQALPTGKSGPQKTPLTNIDADSQHCRIASKPGSSSVYKQLAKNVDLSTVTFDTPFGKAIEVLRNSTDPPLNIVVLWRDLSENALVERDTPIYMEGIMGIPFRTALELLLRAVSSQPNELGYVVDGGVITIATRASLPIKMVTRVYDVTDLVAPPANYSFGLPVGLFGAAAGGFGRGWMRQMPVRGFGRGWRTYGRTAGGYAGRSAMQYDPGRRRIQASAISSR